MAIITSNGTGGGNWSAGAAWVGGVAPVLGTDSAVIAAGDTVVIDTTGLGCGTDPGAGVDGLTINGTLNYSTAADSALTVRGCISVKSGGTLYDGTLLNAAYGVRKHTLNIDCVDAVGKYYLRVEDGGIFKPYSVLSTPWYSRLSADCNSGQAVVKVTDDVKTAGWRVSDYIAIPQCITDGASNTYLQSEIREIASFDATGKEITVTANLTYTHNKVILTNAKVTWKRDCPVVLLSRDIVIQSTNTTNTAYVINSEVTDASKWYPKGVEFKELGKSVTEPSVTYRTTTGAVAYTNPAYGNMSGFSIHPGLSKKGFPGFYYSLYDTTSPADHDFSNWVVVGKDTAGVAGGTTHIFEEDYGITGNLNIGGVNFSIGFAGTTALNFGGSITGQKLVTIATLECAGVTYGPSLNKVGTATEIFVWACYFMGVYSTSLNFNCTYMIILSGNYGLRSSAYSMRNVIANLYTKTTTYWALNNAVDIEITNWVSDDVTLYGVSVGLIEIRVNDYQMVEDDFFTVTQEGVKYSCKSTFASPRDKIRTAGNGALLLDPESATLALTSEKEVSVESGKAVIVSGYMYKDAAYNGSAEPSVKLSGAGMTEMTVLFTAMTDAGDDWYQWTVSGTPTRTTQAYLLISCIGTAGYIVVADVIVLGADVNTGDFLNWSHGASAKILFAIKLPAADVATAVWEKVISTITTANSAAVFLKKIKSLIMIK